MLLLNSQVLGTDQVDHCVDDNFESSFALLSTDSVVGPLLNSVDDQLKEVSPTLSTLPVPSTFTSLTETCGLQMHAIPPPSPHIKA